MVIPAWISIESTGWRIERFYNVILSPQGRSAKMPATLFARLQTNNSESR
jgi:hypothetical protein